MNLTQLFDLSLRGRAERIAVEYPDSAGMLRVLTFADVDARANRMAHELAARGLTRGDRLCVHLANRIEFIDLFLACVRIGVIFVPMNVLYRERELRHIVSDSEPAAIVSACDSDVVYPETVAVWQIEDLSERAASREASRCYTTLNRHDPALKNYK